MAQFFIVESFGYRCDSATVGGHVEEHGPFATFDAATAEAESLITEVAQRYFTPKELSPNAVEKAVTSLAACKVGILDGDLYTFGIEIKFK